MNYQALEGTFINSNKEGFRRLCRLCDIIADEIADLAVTNHKNPAFIEIKILFKNGDSNLIQLARKNYQGVIYL